MRGVEYVTTMPVAFGGPLFVIGFVAVAVAAGLLAHRFFPTAVLDQHNDIAGFMFAVVGVIYAVLLAFLAIAVWQRFDDAHKRVSNEASELVVVYRRIDAFPAARVAVRKDIVRYVDAIVNDEWPKMNRGESSEKADALIEHVAYVIRHLKVTTPTQQDLLISLIDGTQATMMDRDDRLAHGNAGLNTFLWTILYLGAAGVLAFSYLFAYKSRAAQATRTGLLAFTLALVLYLISVIDFPFRGDVRIQPAAFIQAQHTLQDVGY
jgi:hypothetical protein